MTLSSFIDARPPALAGVALMFMWTTVSTDADSITLPMTGLRMSARTNSVRPRRRSISGLGGTVSTPMTRSIAGSAASSAANAPPSHRLTPVTRTTAGGTSVSSLLVAPLDAGLLEELAVLLLRHPLPALLDDRTHVLLPTSWSHGGRALTSSVTPGTVRGDQLVRGQPPPGLHHSAPETTRPSRRPGPAARGSGDVGVGVTQVVVHGALGHPEGAADADGGELAAVDEAVDGHLRDAHESSDLGDGQEGDGGAGGRHLGRTAEGHGGRVRGGHGAGERGGRDGPTHRTGRRDARAGGLDGGALGHGHCDRLRFSTGAATGFPTGGRVTFVLERTIWGPE